VKIAVAALSLGLVAAFTALLGNSQLWAVLAMGFVMASAEIYMLTNMAGGFTAAIIPIISVNGVFLAAPPLWSRVQELAHVSVRIVSNQDDLIRAALIGILFCFAYSAGAMLAGPKRSNLSMADFGQIASQAVKTNRLPNGLMVAAGYAAIGLAIYAYQGALIEGAYLEARGPFWAVALSSAAIPLAVLALCIVVVQRGPWRAFAAVALVILALILISRSTRTLAMLPALLVLARVLISDGRVRRLALVLASAMTLLFLRISLVGRSNPDGVGLIPMAKLLVSRPAELLLGGFNLDGLLGNVLLSAPLTTAVADRSIPSEAFWISINPLPGGLAGWGEIKETLLINAYTPYNSLGELAAQGSVFIFFTATAAGFLVAFSTRIASSVTGPLRIAATLLVIAITSYFSVTVLQYNLRSAARLIWYLVAGVTLIWVVSVGLQRTRPANSNTHSDSQPRLRPRYSAHYASRTSP